MEARRTILVVDDEVEFLDGLCEFLKAKGYKVSEASDGEEALVAYRLEMPDLVLLDARMPGMDGLEVLRELKRIDPEAAVIMVTAIDDEGYRRRVMAEGAWDYITKPVILKDLEMAVKARLRLLVINGKA